MGFNFHQVYDYGDESQQEDINIVGVHNWFLRYIHDPSVRIVVIMSPGLRQLLVVRHDGQDRKIDSHSEEHLDQLIVFFCHQLIVRTGAYRADSGNKILVVM